MTEHSLQPLDADPSTNQTVALPIPAVTLQQQRYLLKGLQGAENTERAYRADLEHYTRWCKENELLALPATAHVLGQYVSELAPFKRWATIARRLAAIRKWHELHDEESPITDRWLQATLKGIQREHGTHAKQSAAFKVDQLKRIVSSLMTEQRGVPRFACLRDKVVLLLGFTGAFRRQELVDLDVQHVQFSEDGVVLRYYGSKTNQTGQLEEKALFYSPDPAICPVRTLKRWVDLLERTSGPLIVRVRKGNELTEERLTAQSVNAIVKRYLGNDYSAHSLRASFVTTAKLNGADDSEVMQQTKHKTAAMIRRYTRLDSIKEHNAAKKLGW
jgi:site-specific recombinase XerD